MKARWTLLLGAMLSLDLLAGDPPEAVRAAIDVTSKCENYRLSVEMGVEFMGKERSLSADGAFQNPDTASLDTRKGGHIIVRGDTAALYSASQKKWVPRDRLDMGEAALAEMLPFLQPPKLLELVSGSADRAEADGSEKVGEVDCAVYRVPLSAEDVATLLKQVAESSSLLKTFRVQQNLNKGKCAATFRLWVDPKTSLIHRTDVEATLVVKGMEKMPFAQTVRVTLSEHGKAPAIEIPPEAEAILSSKPEK